LRTKVDLDGWFIDWLPEPLAKRLCALLDTKACLNLLFQAAAPAQILDWLIQAEPDEVWQHRGLLEAERVRERPPEPVRPPKPEPPLTAATVFPVPLPQVDTSAPAVPVAVHEAPPLPTRPASSLLGEWFAILGKRRGRWIAAVVGLAAGWIAVLMLPRFLDGSPGLVVELSGQPAPVALEREILAVIERARQQIDCSSAAQVGEHGSVVVRFRIRREDRQVEELRIQSPSPVVDRCVRELVARMDFAALRPTATATVRYDLR